MKIKIYVVGKTKASYLQAAEKDFAGRIKKYCTFEIVTIKEEKISSHKSEAVIIDTEARRIIEKLEPGYLTVVLSIDGKQYSSEKFTDLIQKKMCQGFDKFAFIIGGPLGLPQDFLGASVHRLSLSKMTFTHEMCRLILFEQIYRAFSIMRNEKYHK